MFARLATDAWLHNWALDCLAGAGFPFPKRRKGKKIIRATALHSIVGHGIYCRDSQTHANLDRAALLFIFFPFRLL
jgi:hypothetical protein